MELIAFFACLANKIDSDHDILHVGNIWDIIKRQQYLTQAINIEF